MNLPIDLQHIALRCLVDGTLEPSLFQDSDFEKVERAIYHAIQKIKKGTKVKKITPKSLMVAATEFEGVDKSDVEPVFDEMKRQEPPEVIQFLVQEIKQQRALFKSLEAIEKQISQKGTFDPLAIMTPLNSVSEDRLLQPLSEVFEGGIPEAPVGIQFPHNKYLTKYTGGLIGVWVIAGSPGIGKSTLALQLAIQAAKIMPVIHYDFELGPRLLAYRLSEALKTNEKTLIKDTTNYYIRSNASSMDSEILSFTPPALVVIDSFQSLPSSVEHKKESLDKWMYKCEQLALRGYSVLLVSETNRENYTKASMSSFKETGSIEYKAHVGIQLLSTKGDDDTLKVHIVKNRHYPYKGHLLDLTRVNHWWFREKTRGRL